MTTRNLDYFFKPRSVAVIGASRDPARVGGVVASVLGAVPMLVVVFQDPAVQESIRRMTGG